MNTQQRNAMQMALEAMEGLYGGWRCTSAIKACREALQEDALQSLTDIHQQIEQQETLYVADVDMPDNFRQHKKRIVELEQDPERKAALDRARERFANAGKVIEQEPVACQHKRYSVDVKEQTGTCYDCGANGRMRFVVNETTPPTAALPIIGEDKGRQL